MKTIIPEALEAAARRMSYSPAVVVGDLLISSGQIGRDAVGNIPEDLEEEITQAFDNIGAVLQEAGRDFADVVEIASFHTDISELQLFASVKAKHFTGPDFPAWTAIGVSDLAAGARVEIRITALLSKPETEAAGA